MQALTEICGRFGLLSMGLASLLTQRQSYRNWTLVSVVLLLISYHQSIFSAAAADMISKDRRGQTARGGGAGGSSGNNSPGGRYIMCESDGGLSNRLRVLVTHIVLGKYIHNNAQVVMIWDVNDACPGHFLQVFNPIEGVTFIQGTNATRALFAQHAVHVYNASRDGLEKTLLENYKWFWRQHRRDLWNIEVDTWSKIYPTREVMSRVTNFARQHYACEMNAMHIRRTDLELELRPKKRAGFVFYQRFIDNQPITDRFYIMTDNPDSQREFYEAYGSDRIFVYQNITSREAQLPVALSIAASSSSGAAVIKANTSALPVDHRFTTLEHAVIDIFIAAHAKKFQPSPYSSVSDYVKLMKWLYRDTWCLHMPALPPTTTAAVK